MNQDKIKRSRELAEKDIEDIKIYLKNLQHKCTHPKLKITHGSDTGNYCRDDDSWWTDYRCEDCGLAGSVDGSHSVEQIKEKLNNE